MKKNSVLLTVLCLLIGLGSCNKEMLDLENPNNPGTPALQTEEGIKRAALGIYSKFGLEFWWLAMANHDIMGDTYAISAGNFSWRWANQTAKIILSDGTVLTPPQGSTQPVELKARNDRSFGNDNVFFNEWLAMYKVNNHANMLLDAVNSDEISFQGDPELKKNVLRAWSYWWKGYAYSRLGSLYVSAIITDEKDKTNDNFVAREGIIAEANANFDKAIAILANVPNSEAYENYFAALIPDFTQTGNGGILSPTSWVRVMNTYKARNLLVNKYSSDMTPSEWDQILGLAQEGITSSDKIFTLRSANDNDLVSQTAWMPYRSLVNWARLSERLVQEYTAGDLRKDRNIKALTTPAINPSGRGFQYGTRWVLKEVSEGGSYASLEAGAVEMPIAGSYEENQLILAEAKIMKGQVEAGLAHIDAVRTYQNAGLPALVGTGLNQTQAYAELRRERRVGLIQNGVSFYDARRWKVIKKISEGGGRTGAVILGPNGVVDNNATIEYDYMEYWDVPKNELDFNTPSDTSAPVTSN